MMAVKQVVEEINFNYFDLTGVVRDTRFVRCLWPSFDRPTRMFEEGSGGLEIQGPPTPRNVIFPPDTVFLNTIVNAAPIGAPPVWRVTDTPTKSDCFFVRRWERQMVEELQEVTELIELHGLMQEVKVKKPVMVEREVAVITDLDPSEVKG